MRKTGFIVALLTIGFLSSFTMIFADKPSEYNIMLILDGSHGMNRKWEKMTRIAIVQEVLPKVLDTVGKRPEWGFNMGIRLFGDQTPLAKGDCADLRLGAPIEWFDPSTINGVIEGVKPKGKTCLSHGIYSAQDDFTKTHRNSLNSIILIASGADDCNISEFDAVKYVKDTRKVVRSIHIIGLNLDKKNAETLGKVAKFANGYFVNVTFQDQLEPELLKVIRYYARGTTPPDTEPKEEMQEENTKPATN